MKKIYNLNFLKTSLLLIAAAIFSLNSYSQTLSPTVNVSLSNLNCGQLSDLSIDVSQDPGETDIDNSVFTSDAGSFDLSNVNVGDTLGTADMTLTGGTTINSTLIVGATSSYSTIVLSVDNSGTLGSFTLRNDTNGIEITAVSPGDGNNITGGYTSNATFHNLFLNPSTSVLTFSSTITSELGQVDNQSFVQFMGCADFSPTVNISLANNDCGLLTDVTIDVSQDAGEIDMATSLFTTDGGSFDLASLSVGAMVGYATVSVGSNSYTADLFVDNVTGTTATIIENLTSNTFLIENLSSGGVSISSTSPGDNNYTTLTGNSSSVTLQNIFFNTSVGVLGFNSTITSEIGQVDNQAINLLMSCSDFSPTVSTSLSNYDCDSLSSLTINVSQDAGETDMASALFVTDGGAFTISSMIIGDNIGSASLTNGLGTYNTNLYVSSLTGTTAIISDSLGNVFNIENLPSGGVSIDATSPGDNNSLTSGNSSTVTFNDVFLNANSGMINLNSTITSELGEVDNQSFVFYMSCMDFSPTVAISLSDNTCNSISDLTIDVSQDAGETDIASASFVSDGGSFDISGLSLNDVVGSANILFANGTSVLSNLELSLINSLDDFEVQSVDSLGNVLGTFAVTNILGGGVSILATSPPDGNSSTNGYASTATFNNLFVNPNTTSLNFTTTITSELGDVDVQSSSYLICCDPFLTVTVTACDSFDWDGVTYDSTGLYTNVYTDVNGCDSTVTLDLTINNSSSSTVTVTACDSFDWDGVTYDSTGTYTNVYTDVNGCDSTVTLDLTINNSSSSTVTVTACDSFDWDGVTYDSTGTYTNVYTDVNGCDSTVTLDLTIHDSPTDATVTQSGDTLFVTVTTGTAPYTYEWNTGETTQWIIPDSSGTYWCVVTDANGCSDWSNSYVYTSTNVEDISSGFMSVYPNPTRGLINIEFNNIDNKVSSLSIVNVLGDRIYNDDIDSSIPKYSNQLDLSKYSDGIYFVRFKTKNGFITRKLILQ